jgi:adhesin/invasin
VKQTLLLVLAVSALAGGAQAVPAIADGCPSYNPPNELVLGGGTPQSAKLGTPYQTNLQVALANTDACPITTQLSGIAVTFAAPGSGPSGTFASSGANAVLIGTDAQGTAVAPQFTANSLPGGFLATASSDYGSISFSLVNTAVGVPTAITRVSAKSQSATEGARFPQLLRVKVLDANGDAVAGASVTFAVGSSTTGAGASFAGGMPQASETTDASGVAVSPALTANTDSGRFTGTATVAGSTAVATFAFRNLAAKAPRLRPEGGAGQKAAVGAHYRRPLEVKLVGGNGKPVPGATITFNLGAGGAGQTTTAGATFPGGASQATATTDARGIAASPHLVANSASGSFTATAITTGTSTTAVFALRNLASRPASIAAGVAASEATAPRTRFPIPLAAKVVDAHGNPVAGVAVEFTAPARGAGGRFRGDRRSVKATTDKAGVAVAPPFVANGITGGYVVRATARGIDHAAAFGLVNRASG